MNGVPASVAAELPASPDQALYRSVPDQVKLVKSIGAADRTNCGWNDSIRQIKVGVCNIAIYETRGGSEGEY
jgi:hypothetical protein